MLQHAMILWSFTVQFYGLLMPLMKPGVVFEAGAVNIAAVWFVGSRQPGDTSLKLARRFEGFTHDDMMTWTRGLKTAGTWRVFFCPFRSWLMFFCFVPK